MLREIDKPFTPERLSQEPTMVAIHELLREELTRLADMQGYLLPVYRIFEDEERKRVMLIVGIRKDADEEFSEMLIDSNLMSYAHLACVN
jgi:hypothetical protein